MRIRFIVALCLFGLAMICNGSAFAGEPVGRQALGDLATLQGWHGLERGNDGAASWSVPGTMRFEYIDASGEARGWGATRGLFRRYEPAGDWWDWSVIAFDVYLPDQDKTDLPRVLELSVGLQFAQSKGDSAGSFKGLLRTVELQVSGSGWQTVMVPIKDFRVQDSATPLYLNYVKGFSVTGFWNGDEAQSNREVFVRDARLQRGAAVGLSAEVMSRPGDVGETVRYGVRVYNSLDTTQTIGFGLDRQGWEVMQPTIEPGSVTLAGGASAEVTVSMTVPDDLPIGARERWVLVATPQGRADQAARIELITLRRMPSPYIWHDTEGWREVCDKAEHYDWARKQADAYIERASKWRVPEVDPDRLDEQGQQHVLFRTTEEHNVVASAYAWRLTGEKAYAEKVAEFLRRLSDPETGYPHTLQACHQASVQEGHFFQNMARSYDAIRDAGVLTEEDDTNIERTFRIWMDWVARYPAGISNWDISELTGGLYCAMALQDWERVEYFMDGPLGLRQQLRRGVLDDGWWFECSPGYNLWCAQEFTEIGLALRHWGVNFLDESMPAVFKRDIRPGADPGVEPAPLGQHGISFELWGPHTKSSRRIRDLWDSIVLLLNEEGRMFGINDANPELGESVGRYDLAYYAYGDQTYASIVQRGDVNERNLLYSVPDLPPPPVDALLPTAKSDNAGVAILRSQDKDKTPHTQYQAAIKYGTHGGYHGHYDRLNLVYLRRFGKLATSTRTSWWSYHPYMYRFYVQNTITHNMVVVDGKMQVPAQSKVLLHHTGDMMQATVVENVSPWSNPPYGGLVYGWFDGTFAEKQWAEGREIPKPDVEPGYGKLSDFTEPIRYRRALIVTDDYLVLADSVQAEGEHTFDSLLQFQGFEGFDEASDIKAEGHRPKFDNSPLSSGQFTLDNTMYQAAGPVLAHFVQHYKPGAAVPTKESDDKATGRLHIDAHTLWPTATHEVSLGYVAENTHSEGKQLWYEVEADGKMLLSDKTGSWLLGECEVDVDIAGKKQLVLRTRLDPSKRFRKHNLFWGGATVVTKGGQRVSLADLPCTTSNVAQNEHPSGQDYYGGPIHLAGTPYDRAAAAEPDRANEPAEISVDLTGIDPVSFQATLGSDYPLGDASQLIRTYSHRTHGSSARYLTLIELHEGRPVIQAAQASDADTLTVQLGDGRVQTIHITGLDSPEGCVTVELRETTAGGAGSEEAATPEP